MANPETKYHDNSLGYRGSLSKDENMSPALFINSDANKRPIQKQEKFSTEDLQNYNTASIRVLPIVEDFSTKDSFLSRNGSYSSTKNSKVTSDYIGFILVQANEENTEKFETVPLSGDGFASFFYGANPRTYTFTGIALNTVHDNWRDALDILYAEYIRGSSIVKNKTLAQLKYDNRIVTGFISSFSQSIDSSTQGHSTFQMQIIVTDVTHLNPKSTDKINLLNSFSRELEISKGLTESGLANRLLSSARLNSLRDYARVGVLVPPPAPPKPKSKAKSTMPNCIIKPPIKDNQTESESQNKTIDTQFGATTCTGVDYIVALNNQVTSLKDKALEATNKISTTSNASEKARLQAEAEDLRRQLTLAVNDLRQAEDPNSDLSKELGKQVFRETMAVTQEANIGDKQVNVQGSVYTGDTKGTTYQIEVQANAFKGVNAEELSEANISTGTDWLKKASSQVLQDKKLDSYTADNVLAEVDKAVETSSKQVDEARKKDAQKNAREAKKLKVVVSD